MEFSLPQSLSSSVPQSLSQADICSDSLYLSLTYSDAPGMTQDDPRVTRDDLRLTQEVPRMTQDDP